MLWRLRRKYIGDARLPFSSPFPYKKPQSESNDSLCGFFLMQIKYKRLSPHVPRTSPFSSAIFHAARTLSGSLRSPPSPRGEGFIRRYSFSSYVCIRSDVMGKAVFSYRSLPHAGKALSVVILFPHMRVFALTLWGKRYSRIVAFPIGEGGPRQRWIGYSR